MDVFSTGVTVVASSDLSEASSPIPEKPDISNPTLNGGFMTHVSRSLGSISQSGNKTSQSSLASGLIQRVKSAFGKPLSDSDPKFVRSSSRLSSSKVLFKTSSASIKHAMEDNDLKSASKNSVNKVEMPTQGKPMVSIITELPPAIPLDSARILQQATGISTQLQDFYTFLVQGLCETGLPITSSSHKLKKHHYNKANRIVKHVEAWLNDPSGESVFCRIRSSSTTISNIKYSQ